MDDKILGNLPSCLWINAEKTTLESRRTLRRNTSRSGAMRADRRGIEGFTLAELLLVIAIAAVFSAIAIPSFFSIQNNMRISELDSAASNLAQAAQNQMTSKKINGTWNDMLDGVGITEDTETQRAIDLPSGEENSDDIYYMTAEQARKYSILPRNAIDETVYNGDYVIEFSKSTATVYSVFYTDGKTGLFDASSLISGSHPALSYYEAGGSRIRQDRMIAKPMIGYYQGTPAGATDTVVLANPVIWADDFGNLCIENPNLNGSQTWAKNSITGATVTRMENGTETTTAFSIKGLQENGLGFYSVSVGTQQPVQITNTGEISLAARDDSGIKADNFKIDLASILSKMKVSGGDLGATAVLFLNTDDLRIDAQITTTGVAYEPSKATAFLKFPAATGKVMILVTDPSRLSGTDTYTGTNINASKFSKPTVKALTYSGVTSTKTAIEAGETNALVGTASVLYSKASANSNPASAYQAYTGAYMNLSNCETDNTMYLQAQVGSYGSHSYQIFEMWINDTKVGYLYDNKWVWNYGALANKINIPSGSETSSLTSLNVTTYGFAALCASAGVPATEEGAYYLYVRTTPRLSEVSQFVNTTSFYNTAKTAAGTSSSTAARNTSTSANVRKAFEIEFGAPSSVASWTVTRTKTSGITGYPIATGGLRIYYAGTPAFGFETVKVTNSIMQKSVYAVENAALWYAKASGSTFVLQAGTAMVRTAPDGAKYYMSTQTNTDFALSFTSDRLFYRALFYYNESKTQIGSVQYVPHSYSSDSNIASFMTMADKSLTLMFMGWTTSNTQAGNAVLCAKGSVVGAYESQLLYGRVDLTVKYGEPKVVGLIYYENYSDGTYGYYGYRSVGDDLGFVDTLDYSNQKTISDWGYRAVLPQGYLAALKAAKGYEFAYVSMEGSWRFLDQAQSLTIDGSVYESYYLYATQTIESMSSQAFEFGINADWNWLSVTNFSFNVNLAKAVSQGTSMASLWGSSSYPWTVRHASQFVGTFDPWNMQPTYNSKAYVQERDIDLSSKTIAYGTTAFTGSYNGGGYQIKGYQLNVPSGSWRYYAGLFFTATGATLQNINLTDLRTPDLLTLTSQSGNVGFLVGNATSSTIKNCTVDCEQGTDNDGTINRMPINIEVVNFANTQIGGIVGNMTNTTVDSCTFKNAEFIVPTQLQPSHAYRLSFGGLIGAASSSSSKVIRVAQDDGSGGVLPSVDNVRFSAVNTAGTTVYTYFGGVVGYRASTATNTSFNALNAQWFSNVQKTLNGVLSNVTVAIGNS